MKESPSAQAIVGTCAVTMVLASILVVPNAYPEAYIGGQIGTSVAGNSLTDVELTDFSPAGSMSDRSLSRSILGGVKVGYFFAPIRWFGLEAEFFYTTPNIKQQNTTITIQPSTVLRDFGPVGAGTVQGVLSGDHFRVITIAPMNFMFRYPKTRFQPYVGVGPGIFLARVHTTVAGFEGTQSSTKLGLNAKAGAEFYITRHLSAFAEWKYNRASFNFDSNTSGGFGFRADYDVHLVAVDLNVHF